MDIEKMYEVYNRLLQDLARMMPDDPNYAKTLEAAESYAKMIGEYERRDLDRVSNNARTDIQEEQLKIDMAKIKADKERTRLGFGEKLLGVLAAVGLTAFSYTRETKDFVLPFKPGIEWAKKLIRF